MADYLSDSVNTVLGSKRLSELGKTLTHEHLALDIRKFLVPLPKHIKHYPDGRPSLQNVGYLRQYPYCNLYNMGLYDDDAANAVYKDVELFKEAGGGTIVENSNHGLQRNISLLKSISQSSGVNIIAGTGYYVASTQNPSTLNMTKEKMCDLMRKELDESCVDYPDVKAGFIGEVGSTWPIADFEKRSISATGEIQAQLRCSVSFHAERDTSAPMEIMRIYQEAGGDATRAIMSHIDSTIIEKEQVMEFADATKCYIQFDLFGNECSYLFLNTNIEIMSDAQRINCISQLKEEGKLDRVLMSHDIHSKHRLTYFGGHGYSHIINNVVPIMLDKGFTMKEIELMTVENPRRWLTRK